MKIHPVGIVFIHADGRTDGQTDMMKLMGAWRDYANAPNSYKKNLISTVVLRRIRDFCM